ncbi:MAG: radical SAM protein [Candidatus Omnitrophota bacterium]
MTDAIFINPFPGGHGLNEATIIMPVGLAYLAAVLEENDFRCAIIDANVLRLTHDKILEKIPPEAKLIGIYLNSFSYDSVQELSSRIRKKFPEATIVLGGPLPSAAPEIVLAEIECDGLIKGEGEYSVLRLMRNISRGSPAFDREVPGAYFRDRSTNEIVENPLERIEKLDELPFPAYHLLPSFECYKSRSRKRPTAPLVTSRGCSYDCIFCSKDVFKRRVSFRSAPNVLKEIDGLVKEHGIRQIDILDDNFAFNRTRMKEILDGLISRSYGLAVNLQLGIRTECLDEEILDKMKKAGVYKLAFGIESTDEDVLRICHKKIDLQHAGDMVLLARRKGIIVYGFFIIGLPGETDAGFERTLDYASKLDFDVANFCMAIPFVGTELYRMISREGRFLIDTSRNISSGFYDGKVFYEYGPNTEEVVLRRYKKAYKKFYSLRKKINVLLSIRSFSEFRWHWDIVLMIMKSMLNAQFHSLRRAEREQEEFQSD